MMKCLSAFRAEIIIAVKYVIFAVVIYAAGSPIRIPIYGYISPYIAIYEIGHIKPYMAHVHIWASPIYGHIRNWAYKAIYGTYPYMAQPYCH